jgi:membrane-associated phospholipid phosphatase
VSLAVEGVGTERRASGLGSGERRALLGAVAAVVTAAVTFSVLLMEVVASDWMRARDSALLTRIIGLRGDTLNHLAWTVTRAGEAAVLISVAVSASVVLWLIGATIVEAAIPMLSLCTSMVTIVVLKALVGRTRTPMAMPSADVFQASFPSGHAGNSMSLYLAIGIVLAVVVLRRPFPRALVVVTVFAMSVAIGLSRLELGVHWPTDVVAGWAVGVVCAVAVSTSLLLAAGATRGQRGRVRRFHDSSAEHAAPAQSVRGSEPPGSASEHQMELHDGAEHGAAPGRGDGRVRFRRQAAIAVRRRLR